MEKKSISVNWYSDRVDDDIVKIFDYMKKDVASLSLGAYNENEINDLFDSYKSPEKITFENDIIKTLLGAKSNFSVGATIAALSLNNYDTFIIPPDLIDYINEEIKTKDIFEKYVNIFPNSRSLYEKGKMIYDFFIENGYPSQAAYALTGAAYVECSWNPNQYNKAEQSKGSGTAGFAGGWSGCGEGLFGLTGWNQKERIIKALSLNTVGVECYRYQFGRLEKEKETVKRRITSDQKEYDKGPDKLGRYALLFQCTEDTWVKIMKEYISGLNMVGGDNKKPIDYLMYKENPKNDSDPLDDDHRLLYTSYLFKAGYGNGGTTFENLVQRVNAYKDAHTSIYGSGNPNYVAMNDFIKQLLIAYLLSQYVNDVEIDKLSLRNIVKVNDEYIKGKVGDSYTESSGLFSAEEIKDTELGIDDAMYIHSDKVFDENIAAQWITKHSASVSLHSCAKYVRMAIEAGFRDKNATSGRPNWAWKYIYYLPKIGFKYLTTVKRKELGRYKPKIGDIAVYLKNNDKNVPGHICMYNGERWISDFKQNNMFVYKGTNEAHIFRFI